MLIVIFILVINLIQSFRDSKSNQFVRLLLGQPAKEDTSSWTWCDARSTELIPVHSDLIAQKLGAESLCTVEIGSVSQGLTKTCGHEILQAKSGDTVHTLSASENGNCFRFNELYFSSPDLKARLSLAGVAWKDP